MGECVWRGEADMETEVGMEDTEVEMMIYL